MAAQGRLARILEQEYKTKGFVSGTLTGGGKRLREIIDLRNVLFSGGGIGSTIGKKIFGKGYSAVSDRSSLSKLSSPVMGFSQESIELLSSVKRDTRISAKNSIVLPSMARDINLMRQNISKLVKLQGGTATSRADMFFARAKERESAYESQFSRKTPTQIVQKTESSRGSGGILAGLTGLIGLLIPAIISAIKTGMSALPSLIKPIVDNIKTTVDAISNIGSRLFGSLKNLGIGAAATTAGSLIRKIPAIKTPSVDANKTTPKTSGTKIVPTPNTPSQESSKSQSGGKRGPKISGRFGNVGAGGLKVVTSGTESKRSRLFKKFLAVVGKRMGQGVAGKLAGLATSLLVPGIGWIVTLVGLGFLASDAWAIYKIWEEVSGEKDTSPTNLKDEQMAMSHLIYDRFREAGFSDAQARGAVANAMAESRLDPTAHNTKGEDSVGLFQMNRNGGLGQGYTVEELKDPETNIKIAIEAAKQSPMFKKATTMEEATSGFMKEVENPADQSSGAIQKRINFGLAMSGTDLGSRVNYASTDLANAQRNLGTGQSNIVVNQDNSVKNQTMGPSGGPMVSTWNFSVEEALSRQY